MLRTKDFDYELPPELIAQEPAPERALSRLMLVNRATGTLSHYRVFDLPFLLKEGDLMVVNDTRVIPARVCGRRLKTGGKVEALLVEECAPGLWKAMLRSSGHPGAGEHLELAGGKIVSRVHSLDAGGFVFLELRHEGDLLKILSEEGRPPLPPYIKRPKGAANNRDALDRERYQTVYARLPGAIAAPTAGLHFSKELLDELVRKGVQRAGVTLHVGPGTFLPVRCDLVKDHRMEEERFIIEEAAARAINRAIDEKRRVVAVGTTVVRTLESAAAGGKVKAACGRTGIFIYPPYQFRIISALLTNFHLPRSTLLMLVSAFAGMDLIRRAYKTAVAEKYRFYSYGDCMLIV